MVAAAAATAPQMKPRVTTTMTTNKTTSTTTRTTSTTTRITYTTTRTTYTTTRTTCMTTRTTYKTTCTTIRTTCMTTSTTSRSRRTTTRPETASHVRRTASVRDTRRWLPAGRRGCRRRRRFTKPHWRRRDTAPKFAKVAAPVDTLRLSRNPRKTTIT